MSGDLIWALVRLMVALPLVLGVTYLVLKFGLSRRFMAGSGNRRMKLVEQLPLGQKTILSLVTLENNYYLFAHQDNSVSLVKELGELPETPELAAGGIAESTPRPFEHYIRYQGERSQSRLEIVSDTLKECWVAAKNAARRGGRLVKDTYLAKLAAVIRKGGKGEKS